MSKIVADVQGRRSRTMAQFADSVVICSRTRFSAATGMYAKARLVVLLHCISSQQSSGKRTRRRHRRSVETDPTQTSTSSLLLCTSMHDLGQRLAHRFSGNAD